MRRRPPAGDVRRVRSIDGNSPSVVMSKTGRTIQCESFAERAWVLRLDRDRRVRDYQSQPETFLFADPCGRPRRYTPDFKVWYADGGVEIHEVTRADRRTRAAMRLREEAARLICAERGWRYCVQTEESLPQGGELANLLALVHFRPAAYADEHVAAALARHLPDGAAVAVCHLVATLSAELDVPAARVRSALCHLLWHGDLATDLTSPLFAAGALVPATPVWRGSALPS